MVVNVISVGMVQKELNEIADYVSNTLASLYFLVNSTDSPDVFLEKELLYLPSVVENSVYMLKIDGSGGNASKIVAYLKDKSSVVADAWLLPGLKMSAENSIESGGRKVVVGCSWNFTIWIKYR